MPSRLVYVPPEGDHTSIRLVENPELSQKLCHAEPLLGRSIFHVHNYQMLAEGETRKHSLEQSSKDLPRRNKPCQEAEA